MGFQSGPADVLLIGGGLAALAAASELGRGPHHTILFGSSSTIAFNHLEPLPSVLDSVETMSQNYVLSTELRRWPFLKQSSNITVENRRIQKVSCLPSGLFRVEDEDNQAWTGHKLVLATGACEVFPDLEGYDCCADQEQIISHPAQLQNKNRLVSVGVLAIGALGELEAAVQVASQLRQYISQVRIYTDGNSYLAQQLLEHVVPGSAITADASPIQRLESKATGVVIHFANGTPAFETLLYHRREIHVDSTLPRMLELELSSSGAIQVSAKEPYMASRDGVYAAGECTATAKCTPAQAVAMGEAVAVAVAKRLALEQWTTQPRSQFLAY